MSATARGAPGNSCVAREAHGGQSGAGGHCRSRAARRRCSAHGQARNFPGHQPGEDQIHDERTGPSPRDQHDRGQQCARDGQRPRVAPEQIDGHRAGVAFVADEQSPIPRTDATSSATSASTNVIRTPARERPDQRVEGRGRDRAVRRADVREVVRAADLARRPR